MRKLIVVILTIAFAACNTADEETIKKEGFDAFMAEDYQTAIESYTKAININKDCYDCLIYRGISQLKSENFHEAIDDFTKATRIQPGNHLAYANRGAAYYSQADYVNALSDYRKVYAINPGDVNMINNIGHMLYATGQTDSLCYYYRLAVQSGAPAFDKNIVQMCTQTDVEEMTEE